MDNILRRIENKMPKMSKGHKRIAQFISTEYDKAAFMTASKIGKYVGVSESTVVRFAVSLGYDGFHELQKDLEDVVKTKLTSLQRYEISFDKLQNQDVLSKVISADISILKDTLEKVDKLAFDEAVEALLSAKNIYIMGIRSSNILANFLAYYLNLVFDNVKMINTNSMSEMFEQTIRIGKNDVAVGITFPRYSRRTVKTLEYASSKGAKVIGITDTYQSPIMPYCDIKLLAASDMVSFVDSLVAPLSLINALIVAVGMKRKEQVTLNLNNLESIWEQFSVYNKGNYDE